MPKPNQILPKVYQIFSNYTQICPNFAKKVLCQKNFAKGCGRIPSSYVNGYDFQSTGSVYKSLIHNPVSIDNIMDRF